MDDKNEHKEKLSLIDPIFDYDSLICHYIMLSDEKRTGLYKRALDEVVRPGYSVLDLGAGTGIFSLMAAKKGAIVYSVEPTSKIELARDLAKLNGVEGRIKFIKSEIKDVKLPEKVDVIVSDWMGVLVVSENLLPELAYARDTFLKPSGIMIPSRLELSLVPVQANSSFSNLVSNWNFRYGLNLSLLGKEFARDVYVISGLEHDQFLSNPRVIQTFDMSSADNSEFSSSTEYKITKPGVCQGFLGWFSANLTENVVLDTSPFSSSTHWQQTFLPLEEEIPLNLGDKIVLNLKTQINPSQNNRITFLRSVVKNE